MPTRTYIGALVAVSAGLPATIDAAGFAAKAYSNVGRIESFPPIGDTSEDVNFTLLSGRTEHVNGALDGGTGEFAFVQDGVDAGQTLLITSSNTATDVSWRITDPDGTIVYVGGKVANVRDRERTASTVKGMTGEVRINTRDVRV